MPKTDRTSSVYEKIGIGALKYFMLKIDAKKSMFFDPDESIVVDSAPYQFSRICSFRRLND